MRWDAFRDDEAGQQDRDQDALPAPGKRTLTARLGEGRPARVAPAATTEAGPPVQADRGEVLPLDPFAIHELAADGVRGAGGPLPHHDAIAASFGHHDVGDVRAHVGGAAAEASRAIGAAAYATGDDVAFAAAPDLRQAAHEAAHVVQQRGGVRLDGGVGRAGDPYEQHADAVAERVVRGESAEALLDTMAHRGPAGGPAVQRDDLDGDGVDDPPITTLEGFTIAFCREFRAQLHAFGATATVPAAGTPRLADVHAASGAAIPTARLVALFTPGQIEKLTSFMTDHVIPDRLFNGDDLGTATAQQRILMSGHILSAGTYRPGSFAQQVHARMCGHWVNLVMNYAGCADSAGAGVREEFDHTGGLSMSVTESTSADGSTVVSEASRDSLGREFGVGARTAAPTGARATIGMGGLPFAQINLLQPGDWLWVYNDNGSAGGNHSVIFSRWVSGDEAFEGTPYRRAITMSQTSPDAGGCEEFRLLGERFVDTGHGRITPVTHISRVDASTRPLETASDLIAVLGTGEVATENHRFIDRMLHGRTFDWNGLVQHLRERNATLIEQLRPHMTANQHRAFTTVNGGNADLTCDDASDGATVATGEAQIPLLVRLNERLTVLTRNASSLDAGMAAQRDGIEGHREERLESTREGRERLERRIAELQAEHTALEAEHEPLAATVEGYEAHTAEHHRAIGERRRLRARRSEIVFELRNSSMGADERTARAEETDDINRRLGELAPIIERLEADENARDVRHDRREARAAERRVANQLRRCTDNLSRAQRDLSRLLATSGYYTAHGRVGRDSFNGRGEHRPTGLLRNLNPAPAWSSFIRAS